MLSTIVDLSQRANPGIKIKNKKSNMLVTELAQQKQMSDSTTLALISDQLFSAFLIFSHVSTKNKDKQRTTERGHDTEMHKLLN
jgi:hypothetical protein